MIRILLVGCSGKMGRMLSKTVEKFSNLSIVAGIDVFTSEELNYPVFKNISECKKETDVILDFSRPDSLNSICDYSKKNKIPVVFCTTGYTTEELHVIDELSKEIGVFHSANMSIGINVINNILKNISSFLYEDFDIEVIEKHHNQKVDSPSGTALLLANTIKSSIDEETIFVHGRSGLAKRQEKEIGIHAIRGGNIIGEHEVIFAGEGECIELKHSALSREVFAIGAFKACEFMHGKGKGLYTMDDVLNVKVDFNK